MYFSKALVLFVLSACLLDGAVAAGGGKGGNAKGGAGNANAKGGAANAGSATTSAAASTNTNANTANNVANAADAAAAASGDGTNGTSLASSGDNSATLQQSVIQSASNADGNPNITAGQAASETYVSIWLTRLL